MIKSLFFRKTRERTDFEMLDITDKDRQILITMFPQNHFIWPDLIKERQHMTVDFWRD